MNEKRNTFKVSNKTPVSEEQIISYKIPYSLQDTCLSEYLPYQQCMRQNPRIIENGFIHSLPFSKVISKCVKMKDQYIKEYRERELFEEMRKLYVESIKTRGADKSSIDKK